MRQVRYHLFTVVTMLAITLAAGCAALGLPTAETFNQKTAVAYGTITQARETAATLYTAKKITVMDLQNIQNSMDVARSGVETARQIHALDPAAADQKINAIRTGLTAVMAYLATREKAQ